MSPLSTKHQTKQVEQPSNCPAKAETPSFDQVKSASRGLHNTLSGLSDASTAVSTVSTPPRAPALEAEGTIEESAAGEWDLPEVASPSCSKLEAAGGAAAALPNEKSMQLWLEHFARDGNTKALGLQWRSWTRSNSDNTAAVVAWLLERGLEDCSSTETVTRVLEHLLSSENLCVDVMETGLSEYTEEDIKEYSYENPKAGAFMAKLRMTITNAILEAYTDDASSDADEEFKDPEELDEDEEEDLVVPVVSTATQGVSVQSRASPVAGSLTEDSMMQWLEGYARHSDTEELACQWRAWTQKSSSAPREIVGWLLEQGLGDVRYGVLVISILEQLLKTQSIFTNLIEECLLEYSAEDLEDLASENPKVKEFVAKLRMSMTSALLEEFTDEGSSDEPSEASGESSTRHGSTLGSTSQDVASEEHSEAGSVPMVVLERNEQSMKLWLECFIGEGDKEAMACQWQAWTESKEEAPQEIMTWLVNQGLEDSRAAEPVTGMLEHLLNNAMLSVSLLEKGFSQYSAEDFEDIALDNPKVHEFVSKLRIVITSAILDEYTDEDSEDMESDNEIAAPTSLPEVVGLATAVADASASGTFCRDLMMAMRRHTDCKQEAGAPCWRAEPETPASHVDKVAPPAPAPVAVPVPTKKRKTKKERDEVAKKTSGGIVSGLKSPSAVAMKPAGVKLNASIAASETSWVAQMRKAKEEKEAGVTADEEFVRMMRGTLNKLTVEKFDRLSDQIIDLISKSTRPNRGIPLLMQLVFEKATTQHHFINMYANLCVKLHQWATENEQTLNVQPQSDIKRILLNQCQLSFEEYLEPPGGFEELTGNELYEEQVKYKTKMLGNIKLVGELIRNGMLARKIALAVAAELVQDDPIVRDERLETLAVFLETVGLLLDDASWACYEEFDEIFTQVQELVQDDTVSCRIRFLLRDVLDLRRGGWKVKKMADMDKAAPMTIAQVHRKAEQDQKTPKGKGARTTPSIANLPACDWREASKKTSTTSSPKAAKSTESSKKKEVPMYRKTEKAEVPMQQVHANGAKDARFSNSKVEDPGNWRQPPANEDYLLSLYLGLGSTA